MNDNILSMEKELQIKVLNDEIKKLKSENTRLLILLKEAGIKESGLTQISDEEVICVQQIGRLKEISKDRDLTKDEVKNFDLLHKNLKIARGENLRSQPKSQTDEYSEDELKSFIKE